MMILQSHRIRSKAPVAPSETPAEVEIKPGRGRPPREASKAKERVHYPSVCGIAAVRRGPKFLTENLSGKYP